MYPKVKVREQREEADQYAYERSSLQSLKAFEWLSLHHSSSSSSDESPRSVVRVPRAFIPKSPPPSFYPSKEGTNQKKVTLVEEPKNVRATSAPRPRAVLSSPVNDGKIGSRMHTKKELLSGLKNHNSCRNRHTQCKVFPGSTSVQGQNKESIESQNTKGKMEVANSSPWSGQRKRVTKIPA